MKFTVVENFLEHVKGDVITDVRKIEEYLESEWKHHITHTAENEPEPAEIPVVATDAAKSSSAE